MSYNAISRIKPIFSFEVIDMSRKLFFSNTDQIVERYNSVLSVADVAREFGISYNVAYRILKENGVVILSQSDAAIKRSINASGVTDKIICDMFASGIGVRGIYEKTGASIHSIRRILARNGVATRNRSEQQFARMAITSSAERKALASAAHHAVRGRVRSMEELCLMAATREKTKGVRTSIYEDALFASFQSSGLAPIAQKAIGPYNCDIAIGSIAVEVFGGHWHWNGEHLSRTEERFRYIMNSGYDIIVVSFSKSFPFSESSANYLVSYIQELCSNPPSIRQYRVIWGAGEFISGGCIDDKNISINPPFTNSRDSSTGRYKRITR